MRGLGLGIIVTAVIMGIASPGRKSMTDQEIIARAKALGMVEGTVLSDVKEEEEILDPKDILLQKEEQNKSSEILSPADMAKADESTKEKVTEVKPEENKDTKDSAKDSTAEQETTVEKNDNSQEAADDDKNVGKNDDLQKDTEADQNETDAGKSDGADVKENTADANEPTETEAESEPAKEESGSAKTATITIVRGDSSYSVAKKLVEAGIVSSAESFDRFLCSGGYDKRLRTGTFTIPFDAIDEQIARIVTGQE